MEALNQYLSLCWFRNTLDDLPDSPKLFRYSLIFYVVVGISIQSNVTDPLEAVLDVLLETILTLVFIATVLFFVKSVNLFKIVTTAFLICTNFIYVLGTPVMVWVTVSGDEYSFGVLGLLLIWWAAIINYILKTLLPFSWSYSLLMTVVFITIVYLGSFMLMSIIL
jgi:hypothetical protein